VVVILAGALMAYVTVPKGVSITTTTEGIGESPSVGDVVFVNYTGKLADGTVFEQSQPFPVPVPGILPEGTPMLLEDGQIIPGFIEGLTRMQKGGKYELHIPADKAYGANPAPGSPIPPNADLVFEIELVDFMSRDDMDRRVATIRQMVELQQAAQDGEAAEAPAQ
ncbi:MAG TPA: FKBP-type peptidyl-prolyl cis-trans isomerase, partial [Sphingomonadaceae bacterium]|nr:FKBP-type peptidyl-prolyl cis-trans isomerase [Sphingomonadaceae bacterium]